MIGAAIRFSIRQALRNKIASILNWASLTVGFSALIFLSLTSLQDFSYDFFHPKKYTSYLLFIQFNPGGYIVNLPAPSITFDFLSHEIADVDGATRVYQESGTIVRTDDNQPLNAGTLIKVDPYFPEMFNFPLLEGEWRTLFAYPRQSIFISSALSKKCFGNSDPIGKRLKVSTNSEFTVVGVLKNVPQNSSLQFDMVIPTSEQDSLTWADKKPTLIYFNSPGGPSTILQELQSKVDSSMSNQFKLQACKVADQHYEAPVLPRQGNREQDYRLILIGLIILMVCFINHVSLATSQIIERTKELGIRRIVGANALDLIIQILLESFFGIVLTFGFSFLLVCLAGGLLETTLDLELNIAVIPYSWYLIFVSAIILGATALISAYPLSFLLASKPIDAFREKKGKRSLGVNIRRSLIVFQFAISLIFVAYTGVIVIQNQFLASRPLGFAVVNDLFIDVGQDGALADEMSRKFVAFRNGLLATHEITNVSVNPMPGFDDIISRRQSTTGEDGQLYVFKTDEQFCKEMGVQILQGRDLSETKLEVLLNESASKMLFNRASPINQPIAEIPGAIVVGVVSDFAYQGFFQPVQPLVIMNVKSFSRIHIRYEGNQETARTSIGKLWKSYFPDFPLQLHVLKDEFSRLYLEDRASASLFTISSLMAVVVASLGILGLASFFFRTKVKELSVRKVFGASTMDLLIHFSKIFLLPIVLAGILAVPVIYKVSNDFLQRYSVRTSFPWYIVAVAILAMFLMAIGTIMVHAVRVLREQPSKNLREG